MFQYEGSEFFTITFLFHLGDQLLRKFCSQCLWIPCEGSQNGRVRHDGTVTDDVSFSILAAVYSTLSSLKSFLLIRNFPLIFVSLIKPLCQCHPTYMILKFNSVMLY